MIQIDTSPPRDPETLARIREELIKQKDLLWQEVADDLEKEGDNYQALVRTIHDNADAALADLLESTAMGLVEIKGRQLVNMDDAIHRIDNGTFGLCTECGGPIAPKRLQVQLYAPRCVPCQQRLERIDATQEGEFGVR